MDERKVFGTLVTRGSVSFALFPLVFILREAKVRFASRKINTSGNKAKDTKPVATRVGIWRLFFKVVKT
jgi:hypothetical protein